MKTTMAISILAAMAVCMAPFAAADVTTFTFAGLEDSQNNLAISRLLTSNYGSRVYAEDVEIRDNDDGDNPVWEGKEGWNNFLRVQAASGDMEIRFLDEPICYAAGEGYAFKTADSPTHDFTVTGYGINYGSMENPQHYIGSQGVYTGDGHDAPFSIEFDKPVYCLVFSGLGGNEAVGIDNLSVESMPVPGAFVLTGIGASLVGWMRRRKMIS